MHPAQTYVPKTREQAEEVIGKLNQFKGCNCIGMNGNTFVEIWKTLEEGLHADITKWAGYRMPVGAIGQIWGMFIYLDNSLEDWKIKSIKRVEEEVVING